MYTDLWTDCPLPDVYLLLYSCNGILITVNNINMKCFDNWLATLRSFHDPIYYFVCKLELRRHGALARLHELYRGALVPDDVLLSDVMGQHNRIERVSHRVKVASEMSAK